MSFVENGKTAAVKKYTKGKYHGYGMVNYHLLSDRRFVSEEAKKMFMADKRQECQAKKRSGCNRG